MTNILKRKRESQNNATTSLAPSAVSKRTKFLLEDGAAAHTNSKSASGLMIPRVIAQCVLRPKKASHSRVKHNFKRPKIIVTQHGVEGYQPISLDGPFDTRSPSIAAKTSPYVADADDISLNNLIVPDIRDKTILSDYKKLDSKINWLRNALTGSGGEYLSPVGIRAAQKLLTEILKSEADNEGLDIITIASYRLDKVIEEIVDKKKNQTDPFNPIIATIINKASIIQRSWDRRFGDEFLDVERIRARALITITGPLQNVRLSTVDKSGQPKWIAYARNVALDPCRPQNNVGEWFMNLACAYRDGFVKSEHVNARYGPNEIATVPLLTGLETHDQSSPIISYRLKGPIEDMMVHLQDNVGKSIQILRGHQLLSRDAPAIGLRYDGQYHLTNFSINQDLSSVFHLELRYYRVKSQKKLEEVIRDAITPSRQDDWELYQQLEIDEFHRLSNPEVFKAWITSKEKQLSDKLEFQKGLVKEAVDSSR